MTPRIRATAGVFTLLMAFLGASLGDAAVRRAERENDDARHQMVVGVTGLPDLALSSSARWLRHPSQAEAGAATSDLPARLDVDPAGSIIGAPRLLFHVGGGELQRR